MGAEGRLFRRVSRSSSAFQDFSGTGGGVTWQRGGRVRRERAGERGSSSGVEGRKAALCFNIGDDYEEMSRDEVGYHISLCHLFYSHNYRLITFYSF